MKAKASVPHASATAFKQGMRALAASVHVIAANGPDGMPIGLTATAVTSLSADPPSLLVCVNQSASIAPALREGQYFSVNLLSAKQQEVAQAFGGQRVAKGKARFVFGGWFRSEHETPLLAEANVAFECVVSQITTFATHAIIIGSVIDVRAAHPIGPALVYFDGRYTTIG